MRVFEIKRDGCDETVERRVVKVGGREEKDFVRKDMIDIMEQAVE